MDDGGDPGSHMNDAGGGGGYDANSTGWSATPVAVVQQQTRNATAAVDARAASTQAWLVKIPKFVKEKWDAVGAQPGVDLGVLRVYAAAPAAPTATRSRAPQITLHLPRHEGWTADLPKQYNVNLTSEATKGTYVFTTNAAQDTATAFTAAVVHEATVTPIIDAEYRTLAKRRQEEESRKRKNIVEVDFTEGKRALRIQSTMGGDVRGSIIKASQTALNQTTAQFNQTEKKERLPRDLLIGMLIQAFNENEYWSFKNLQERTAQPSTWLKEVLGDVAQLVKKGLYATLYELKPELKRVGDAEDDNDAA
ncbi:hypothetical protein HDU84_001514 [Entophlyctis sp. JEL0112]|nr:hypothetical protein HDU84_001514 [Entophlyctis sp. JEL0112]